MNTVWAFAKLHLSDHPLLQSLSAEALRKLNDFSFQWLVRTSWACAKIRLEAPPLLNAISEAVRRRQAEFLEYEPQVLTNFLWS